MYYRSRAIILRARNLRESDQLVTVFTEKEGKLTAVAKGVKKPKSSLRGCVQPFCHSLLFFSQGRNMDIITQGRVIDFFGNSREDLNRTLYNVYMMEIMDKSLMDKVPLPGLYQELLAVLEIIDAEGFNPLLVRLFESRLLVHLGYKPVLDQCVQCGGRVPSQYAFSLADGGLVCAGCSTGDTSLMHLRGDCLALIRLLSEGSLQAVRRVKASPEVMRQLESFLERYLEYHVEQKFRVKNTIRWLKQAMAVSI
ncbi:MAG: DNA repair protein RecO [Syntrophomonas sp.]|nr:DNA repair protein RecO [Syntrophomonas sp.]